MRGLNMSWSSKGESFLCMFEGDFLDPEAAIKVVSKVMGIAKIRVARVSDDVGVEIKLTKKFQTDAYGIGCLLDILARSWDICYFNYANFAEVQMTSRTTITREQWLNAWNSRKDA